MVTRERAWIPISSSYGKLSEVSSTSTSWFLSSTITSAVGSLFSGTNLQGWPFSFSFSANSISEDALGNVVDCRSRAKTGSWPEMRDNSRNFRKKWIVWVLEDVWGRDPNRRRKYRV